MAREYKYSDIDVDFNKNEFVGDISIKKDRNAIRQSVMNIVLTRKGEKPFNRDFGVGVHDLLFENVGPFEIAQKENTIKAQLERYEPRVTLDWLEMDTGQIDANQVGINIHFFVYVGAQRIPIKDSLSISLVKVR